MLNKIAKIVADPVLRRWLLRSLLTGQRPQGAMTQGHPPYLSPVVAETPTAPDLAPLQATRPHGTVSLPLAGTIVSVTADDTGLFARDFADGETLSALHRFSWIPLLPDCDPAWVSHLWRHWRAAFAQPDGGPAWEAYTAAERAINILDFSHRHGWPGSGEDTTTILARHVPAILERLEYFGETGTCNHLANNGRGLYRLGLALAMPAAAAAGLNIMMTEAERLFLPSGVLREASTHYHLLYVRNLADCWLAARRHHRPERKELGCLLVKLWGVLPQLALPGGLPLMGDISPDSPPNFLNCLLPGTDGDRGWTGLLNPDDRAALLQLRDQILPVERELLAQDGWLRADFGPWSGLWHVETAGWRLPTGHGHEDLAAPEIHFDGFPLFVDPGRGGYGESGDSARYASARVHGGLQVDNADPYPINKPYYDAQFRQGIVGGPPLLTYNHVSVAVRHPGWSRLGRLGEAVSSWDFADGGLTLRDRVEGCGRHRVVRRLVLAQQPREQDGALVATCGGRFIRLTANLPMRVVALPRWSAYATCQPGWAVEIEHHGILPVELRIVAQPQP